MGEEAARAPVATLDLVGDEHGAVAAACLGEALCELLGCQLYAAHTLYALQDDGADVALVKLGLPGREVVEGEVGDVAVGVDGRDDLGVVGDLHGEAGAAVEGLGGAEHACAAVGEAGQLQGVLVGLGAAVDEE